jgi:branched-chain amino acid transport system substrate-binding protein
LLGTQLALDGPVADLGLDSLHGVELAIRFREQILGHPIELVVENDSCEKDLGLAVTEQLVSMPEIAAIIGPTCSSVALETAAIVSGSGYVMVSPSNTTPELTIPGQHMPGYFRTAPNDIIQGLAMAEFAFNDLGVRKAAAIHDGDIYTMNLAHIFVSVFEEMGGEIVALVPVVQGEAEAEVVLIEMAELDPEFIFYPLFSDLAAEITNLARGIEGLEDTFLATADGAQTPLFLEQAGLNAQGVLASNPDIQLDSPFYAEVFLPAYVDTYGMEPPAPYHAHAFDATMIILNAIENVAQRREDGSLLIGRLALREALYATRDHEGLSGIINCNEYGDCGDSRISISEVQNGEFVRIWP